MICTPRAGLARDRADEAQRLDDPVTGQPDAANDVVHLRQRPALAGLRGVILLDFHAEAPRERRGPAQLHHALVASRHGEAAGFLPAGRQATLARHPRIKRRAAIVYAREAGRHAHPPDGSGRVPRGTRAQLILLQHQDAGGAEFGELVRQRTAGDAAADDHDARRSRETCRLWRHLVCLLISLTHPNQYYAKSVE